MSERMVGLDESFQRGYEAALRDIQNELNRVRYKFNSISVPIIQQLIDGLDNQTRTTQSRSKR